MGISPEIARDRSAAAVEIRTFSLDPNLTVAEIAAGTGQAWHFLPFEHCRAKLHALDERYVLAIGRAGSRSTSLAIFDTVERRRTNLETNGRLFAHTRLRTGASSWCYAPSHRSVFMVESARESDGKYPNPFQYLRHLSVDGSVNRSFRIAPDFSSSIVLPRDDGRIVCVGLNQVAVVDPASGDARIGTTDLIHHRPGTIDQSLRWFSPDGRWGLRTHEATIAAPTGAHARARPGGLLSRLFPRAAAASPAEVGHPDLPSDGARRFGRALDLFRLDPLCFERRLILRWDAVDDATFATLERLCDPRDPEVWNARDAWISSLPEYAPERRVAAWLYDWIEEIRWDEDGQGITVAWVQERRDVPSPFNAGGSTSRVTVLAERHISLDGRAGPISVTRDEVKAPAPLPRETAIEAIKALVRERSTQIVPCSGWSAADVGAALREMRRRIEERGLGALVFGGRLQFRVRVAGRTIGEKKFFATIRTMADDDVAALLPELRALLRSYGAAARAFRATSFGPIASGPSDRSPAALSEAALTLAERDDSGFDALRDWVAAVDQEHDDFAATKVFPAIARRTGFATRDALRFGLWLFLQQWQTVKYEKSWLGLFQAAPAVMAPAAFAAAVLEEALDVSSFSDATDLETGVANVRERLGRTPWDLAVSTELNRLLASRAGA